MCALSTWGEKMRYYDQFKKRNMNLSCVGFEQRDHNVAYFCTPKGANVLGWAGVDGIHYCFVRGFGEMVFAVSPMNLPGEYVHPIARNFQDLLRLLLACGDMAAIEQAHAWDRAAFDAFLNEQDATPEQEAVLEELKNRFSLSPMEDPFGYIKALQEEFDYGRLRFTPEYYDALMNTSAPDRPIEWKVYYNGGYWGGCGRERAGRELRIDRQFSWGDEEWHVPALYSCGKGLVMDFCMEIDTKRLQAFLEQWAFSNWEETSLTPEQRTQIWQDNPQNVEFRPTLYLNGRKMRPSHSSELGWIPEELLPEGEENPPESAQVIAHYGLDKARAWSFHRCSFPWATKRKPEIRSLRLNLERKPATLEGIHFKTPSVGDAIAFRHPVFGTEHKLTVLEYERQELPEKALPLGDYDYPRHYTAMTYTLEPDLPDRRFQVLDCAESDGPRQKSMNRFEPQAQNDAFVIGIIGGADGPTMIISGAKEEDHRHIAMSALHFAPADDVEWKIVFREKRMEDLAVDLLTP